MYLVLLVVTATFAVAMAEPAIKRAFHSDVRSLRLPGFWLSSATVMLVVLAIGIMDGVLPLHLATRLSQTEIGLLYAGASLLVAASAAVSAKVRPASLVLAATALIVAGIAMAGLVDVVPLWIVAFGLAGLGAGAGYTGSAGVLLDAVGTQRIVTALVVWSQVGIIGYLLGPLAGGAVVQGLGYAAIGLVPAAAAVLVVAAQARAASAR